VQLLEYGRTLRLPQGPWRSPPRRRGPRGPTPTVVGGPRQAERGARGRDAQARSDLGNRRHHEVSVASGVPSNAATCFCNSTAPERHAPRRRAHHEQLSSTTGREQRINRHTLTGGSVLIDGREGRPQARSRSGRGARGSGSHTARAASATLRDERGAVVVQATMLVIIVPLNGPWQDVSDPEHQETFEGPFVSRVPLGLPGVPRDPIPGALFHRGTLPRGRNATFRPLMHHALPTRECDLRPVRYTV